MAIITGNVQPKFRNVCGVLETIVYSSVRKRETKQNVQIVEVHMGQITKGVWPIKKRYKMRGKNHGNLKALVAVEVVALVLAVAALVSLAVVAA